MWGVRFSVDDNTHPAPLKNEVKQNHNKYPKPSRCMYINTFVVGGKVTVLHVWKGNSFM